MLEKHFCLFIMVHGAHRRTVRSHLFLSHLSRLPLTMCCCCRVILLFCRRDTDIRSRFSRRIALNVPLASAAMDTVTEARLAIGMAEAGGIGVIHKNLTPEKQATQVRLVKKYEAGMVRDPITIGKDQTIEEARNLTQLHTISGIPVVDGNNQLQGIVTNRDLRFATQLNQPVSSIMTRELITASEGISWNEAREVLHKKPH